MGKAINAFVDSVDQESENTAGTKLVFLDFKVPKVGCREKFIPTERNRNPQTRVVTEVREVKYLRDGFVKEEGDIKPRRVTLESFGTEIVKEVLVDRNNPCAFVMDVKVVGQVVRDLRRKEENGSQI